MKIASYNVNSLRVRLPIVLQWLADSQADVLCVQETKVVDPDFPLQAFQNINYNAVFRGEKSYNGVALFRYPGGPLATVSCSFTNPAGENTTEIVCEKGSIIQNYGDGFIHYMIPFYVRWVGTINAGERVTVFFEDVFWTNPSIVLCPYSSLMVKRLH